MGPTDSKRPAQLAHLPAHGSSLSSLGHATSHVPEGEYPAGSSHHADPTDAFALNWESAWIDLGGEG